MSEPTLPSGAPDRLTFAGILEGKTTDPVALQAAAAALDGCGAGSFACEVTGGRFTLLPRSTHMAGSGFGPEAQARFLAALQALARTAAPASIESTLRCRMVYAHDVIETLFVLRSAGLEALSRARPRTADDDIGTVPVGERALPFGLRRREVMLFGPVLLLLGLFLAWQSGLVDRLLAARAEKLAVDTGPFGQLLAVQLQRSWGGYGLELRRGPTYPADPKALSEQKDKAATLPERAACELTGNGGEMWVQLRNGQGKVLESLRVELRPLLLAADGVVKERLSGHMQAAVVALSLTKDAPQTK